MSLLLLRFSLNHGSLREQIFWSQHLQTSQSKRSTSHCITAYSRHQSCQIFFTCFPIFAKCKKKWTFPSKISFLLDLCKINPPVGNSNANKNLLLLKCCFSFFIQTFYICFKWLLISMKCTLSSRSPTWKHVSLTNRHKT